MDISNPGRPLINTDRFFVDEYVSRNEGLADIMRRMGFCEEKGSGTDKARINSELYKLPPMRFSVSENKTTVTLFSYRPLSEINKQEIQAACYQDACIKSNAWQLYRKHPNLHFRCKFECKIRNLLMFSVYCGETGSRTYTFKKYHKIANY